MKKMFTLCLFVVSLYAQAQTINHIDPVDQPKWIKTVSHEGMGYLNTNGDVVLNPVYEELHPFGELKPDVAVIVQDGKSGLINRKGEIIVAPDYDSITIADAFNVNWLMVSLDGEFGLINLNGEIVVPVVYDELIPAAQSLMPEVIEYNVNKEVIRSK
jgi:hypothetical protein